MLEAIADALNAKKPAITSSFAQDCSQIFISEYVEGRGNNKAIEIYNPTDQAIDMSQYFLQLNSENQTIDFVLGEIAMLEEVQVTANLVQDRKTPVAVSTLDKKEIVEELGSQDLPMILNSKPGVHATQQGGGDGDARITIRGFDQRNVGMMIDGVPVNDMENGWVYWSNWFGLDQITQQIQVQRGLGATKLAMPSVGGTMNIVTENAFGKPEAGYGFRHKKVSVNANGYFTMWENKPFPFGVAVPDPDDPTTFVRANVNGMDALHMGVEVDAAWNIIKGLTLEGMVSYGDWTWRSAETINVLGKEFEFDARGVHVGDAAQSAYAASVRWEFVKNAYVKFKYTYFDRYYSNFDPFSLTGANGGKESWKIPSYGLLTAHAGYTL
ncbi:TonB-dependent receptor plug domain protein, partial [Ancylostoma ceylanicum]